MTIDQYIAELTKLRQAHGPGLDVTRASGQLLGTFVKAPLPRIAYTHVKRPRCYFDKDDLDQYKGDKVVRV